ncbi:MAG: transcription-repair coupling factor, partial [Rhodospirillales bacterium]|nr:transcription-repair coupling factor [Rhodospirillales bacterium]
RVVVTTVSALMQRVVPRESFSEKSLSATRGDRLNPETLIRFMDANGYTRTDTVMEAGEYAVRGGILDLYPPGEAEPLRLDFFGDELESVRTFDPVGQMTTGKHESFTLKQVSEVQLDSESISRFRSGYRELFGAPGGDDVLYESVSAGRRALGIEHWLPLFYARMETLFDYLPGALIILDHQAEESRDARLDLIAEYFTARADFSGKGFMGSGAVYHPIPPQRLYLDEAEWNARLKDRDVGNLSPFASPEGSPATLDAGGRPGRDFAEARVQPDVNVFDVLKDHVKEQHKAGIRVVISAFTNGSRERLSHLFREHGLTDLQMVESWAEVETLPATTVPLAVVEMERGFATQGLAVVSEQDILGERLGHPGRRKVRPENFIADATSLNEGDLVVHTDHGIGRYEGLITLEVAGVPHDCLQLVYADNNKLFLPVENIEIISRFGSESASAQLDRLGGAGWQARKSRLKQRIRDMAEDLIKVAAARELRSGDSLPPPEGIYDEFCTRFPYDETEDQRRSISDVIDDLSRGRPTDRLICGDVGFGKTEVALRAAFIAAMSGKQVAVVVPTTLLARQHYQNFRKRFEGYPVRIEQLSRLVTAKNAKSVKAGLKDGSVDIVIGTHALMAKDVAFLDLGLLIIDEEQHFGVAHKERLKRMKTDVHVLTLTATPIPRTLQLALTGVREMSLIATPPVDRLAVRTFVMPYDPVVIREAIQRERYRGGQVFYVCPRVRDLEGVARELKELVPDAKVVTVNGQMPVRDLEDAISSFYDGAYDILLSTNIIESGLDLPSVNTIIIHRADMFGLAQLYQLRGRVGRSKIRAYAYLTLPQRQKLTPTAERRLEVMQTLDTLGAGFTLASHDLDIRGAGNLLGEEQSGHIREVGIELYQQMLEEAVAEARGLDGEEAKEKNWSPQIGIGMPVLIPESYVSGLSVRMNLYRRIAFLKNAAEIESFAAEMIDRFGTLPEEVENLLRVVAIKQLCREAGVEKIDAGPKGAVLSFRNNSFANPVGLVDFITAKAGIAKLRPDHTLLYKRSWDTPQERLDGVRLLMKSLSDIARAEALS